MSKFAFSQRSKKTLKAFVTVLLAGTAAGCSSDLTRFSYYQALDNGQLTTASVKQPHADSLAPVGVGTQAYPGSYRAPIAQSTYPVASTSPVQTAPVVGTQTYPVQASAGPVYQSQPYPGSYRSPTPLYTASVPTSVNTPTATQVAGVAPTATIPAAQTPTVVAPTVQSAPLPAAKKPTLAERIRKALNQPEKRSLSNVVQAPVPQRAPIIRPITQTQDPITTASVAPAATSAPTIVPMAPDPIVTGSLPTDTTRSKGGWSTIGGTHVKLSEGETVYNLSRRYGVPAAEILKANNIHDSRTLKVGQSLTIPVYVYSSAAPVSAPDNNVLTQSASSYKGSKTLFPRGSQTPVPQSRNPQLVSLPVTTPASQPVVQPAPTQSKVHIVASGDTLNRIAYKHKVSVADLKKANGLTGSSIRIGQKLKVPGASFEQMAPDQTTTATINEPVVSSVVETKTASVTETAMVDQSVTAPEKTGIDKLRWPAKGQIVTSFGGRTDEGKRNDGIDMLLPEGTEIKAAENGVVIYADSGLKGYGNTVLVRHKGDIVTVYAHAKDLKVKRGDQVQRGQVIALSGMSGTAKRPKLHFEVRKNATPQNPITFLD